MNIPINNDPDLQRDDDHPIPVIDVCDIEGARKDGGADLVIVIAKPMGDDRRSQARLVKKIEAYLGYIRSATFMQKYGEAAPDSVRLIVRHHPDTDPGVLKLLVKCRGWVEDNGALLVIQPI